MTPLRSILAMELCLRFDEGLHRELRQLVASHPAQTDGHAKWDLYRAAAGLLLGHLHSADRGCWDYFDDDERARKDFEMWSQGMITREGAREAPSSTPGPYRGEPRFMTFTMAFLILQNTAVDESVELLCSFPDQALWQRSTFARILSGLGTLSFSVVDADVLYLIPRDPEWALTAQDLDDPKFEYLRKIEG